MMDTKKQKTSGQSGDRPPVEQKRGRVIAMIAAVAAVCVAFAILLPTVIIPNGKYNAAVKLYNAGEYEEAAAAFAALDGYRDSADRIASCETAILDGKYDAAAQLCAEGKYDEAAAAFEALDGYRDSSDKVSECAFLKQASGLTDVTVGSTIRFGFYEQDNDPANGKEEIEWIVLAADGDKALLISKYALDCQQYSESHITTTWDTCPLRPWLNGTFCQEAFSPFHQARILDTTVTADENPVFDTPTGNDTTDKVFLLSIPEVIQYFGSNSDRQCQATAYCVAQGAYEYRNGGCYWWLRTPGLNPAAAAIVRYDGAYINLGYLVSQPNFTVRPAIWIDLGQSEERSSD